MITEAPQIDLCTPTTGPPGPAKSAHARHVGVITWSNQPRNRLGFSQGARAKGGSHTTKVGLETTCVGGGQGMTSGLEWLP
jgi:hypothetical protein